jgi:hypothetical protein
MKRDLDMVDDTFELFEGGGDFAESFSLFDDTKTEPTATTETTEKTTTKEKKKIDSEKLTQALTSVGGAVASGVTLYKAYENPQVAQMRASKKQQQLELREVCGRKPLLKKKQPEYNKCVENYNTGKAGVGAPTSGGTGGGTPPPTPQGMSTTTKVLIGVGVLVVGFFVYKKFFKAKATA